MVKKLFSRTWPQLVSILFFLLISAAYFSPLLSGKKVMFQHDIKQAMGMAHEVELHKEATGEQSLWTNGMFGGMPTYQIKADYPNNWSAYIFSSITYAFGYDRYPMTSLWLLMTCFFLMLLAFGINVWAAAVVAIAYGFTTYNLIGIETGHANKVWSLMYAPIILAGIRLAFDKKYLTAAVVTSLGLAVNIYANHLQITYYLFLAIVVWMLVQLVFAIRQKQIKDFLLAGVILAITATIGIASNTSSLWTTYEYGKESTRGGTDLTFDENASPDGLDKTYVFDDYSYGNIEVFTFLIPNFSGGASTMDIDKKSELAKALKQSTRLPTYWGGQRYVAGPYYLGAILIFLMVLGLVLSDKLSLKIWLISVGLLALFLSMGQNSFLSYIFYDHVPFYNKFRVPTMITAITQICMGMLAALGLNALWNKKDEPKTVKKLNVSFYITGGLCLLLALIGPSLFDFSNVMDEQYGIKDQMLTLFQEYRQSMMQKDAFRSFFIIALAWAALLAIVKNKLTAPVGLGIIALMIIGDQWMVNRRYMSGDTYKRKSKTENLFIATVADQQILNDKDLGFRVLNMAVSPFNDATNSYFHKSVGGYHGAKLRRYQELIEYGITPEMQSFQEIMQQQNVLLLDSAMRVSMPVMNMLNTRYFILNQDGAPLKNAHTNGNAWFVKEARKVKNADEELLGLKTIDTKQTALIDTSRWQGQLGGFTNGTGEGSIRMVSYAPNHLVYESSSQGDQLAVFSEIYYPYGWTATIDGQPSEHFRCNFVLRCMKIPAGNHKIEFRFEPESYVKGEKISLIASVLLVFVSIGGTGLGVYRLRKKLSEEA